MYILEGTIGAGKSTFLALLAQHMPEVTVSQEPVNDWQQQLYGQSLLTNFYEQPHRWAYTFETLTMVCRVKEHLRKQQQRGITIVERSVYSGHYCFAKNSHEQGFMNNVEWAIYQQWFDLLVHNKCKPPHGFIYLRTSPDIAYQRIKKRNRHAEKTLSMKYLKQINQTHETFLRDKCGILEALKQVPVLELDCDQEFENDQEQFNKHLEVVRAFIRKTQRTTQMYKAPASLHMVKST